MHRFAVAVLALLIAAVGAMAPAAAPTVKAAGGPKVAIIVGSTGSVTATYRAYADELYATATQYTDNVVRVYSPDATWSRVKAAVDGAAVVVYIGHGNGWPSPYGNDAAYTTKDGFGLNYDTNGDGVTTDSELKYYGEPSIRTLTPAPNAVVLLFHLCYASGNSEPGQPDPTLDIARQRTDNYAAAFQAAGAGAVIAVGHSHNPYYLSALLGQRESLYDYFVNAPDAHHNLLQFASVRTPGRTLLLDPDQPTPWGFWRSFTGDPTLTTAGVGSGTGGGSGGGTGGTGGDPATIVVPVDGSPTSGGVTVDTIAPTLTLSGSAGTAATTLFTPNGDRSADTVSFRVRSSEAGSASGVVRDAGGNVVSTLTVRLNGASASLVWDGTMTGGVPAPDGAYGISVTASDAAGNSSGAQVRQVLVDRTLGFVTTSTSVFYPQDGDGYAARAQLGFRLAGSAVVDWKIVDGAGRVVRTIYTGAALGPGASTFTWDGRNDAGAFVVPGAYASQVVAIDGIATVTQRAAVVADAFRIVAAPARPARGQRLTITVYSAEPLVAAPTITIAQPGIAGWKAKTARVSGNVYRAVVTLRPSAAGTMRLAVAGTDIAGGIQTSSTSLPLR